MPEIPMYTGAHAQLGNGAVPLTIPDIGIQAAQHANQRGAAALDETVNEYFKIQDFGESQKMEGELRKQTADFDTEFKRRASLAPGSPDALYDEHGSLLKSQLDNLVTEYSNNIGEIRGNFITPEARLRSDAMRQQVSGDLGIRAYGKAAELGIQRTREYLDDNVKLAITQRDYDGAIRNIEDAIPGGLLTRTQADERILAIRHDAAWEEGNDLAVSKPRLLQEKLDNHDYDGILTPLEQYRLRGNLRSKVEAGKYDFLKSFLLTKDKDGNTGKGSSANSGKKDDTPEFTGMFTKQECRWIHAMRGKQFDAIRPEIVNAAIEEATSYNPMSPNSPDWETWRDTYMTKYDAFGLDKEFLNRQMQIAERSNKDLLTPNIDLTATLDKLEYQGGIMNQKELRQRLGEARKEDSGRTFRHGWEQGDPTRGKYAALAGIAYEDDADTAAKKYEKYITSNHIKTLRGEIAAQWKAWRESSREGKDATAIVQFAKLQEIARSVTGNKGLRMQDDGKAMSIMVDAARNAQRNRYDAWYQATGQADKSFVDTVPHSVPPDVRRINLGFDSSQPQLPPGVLLPREMMEGIDSQQAVMEVTFDNKHFRRFRVVGTCDGDTPQMTSSVAKQGFYDPDASYSVDMTIQRGNADNLMEPEELGKKQESNQGFLGGLEPYRQTFLDAGKEFGVDPYLLMSISLHETGKGTSSAFRNKRNAMGVSDEKGPRSFSSVEESIRYMAKSLKKNYIDKGRNTIASIASKYAPVGAGNDPRQLNRYWADGVTKYYNNLTSNNF